MKRNNRNRAFLNRKGTKSWREEEVIGGAGDGKGIKMCCAWVPMPDDECNHYVL